MAVTHCPSCGYETRGLRSAICPECGATIPAVAPPTKPKVAVRASIYALLIIATAALAYIQTFVAGVPRLWGVLPLTVIIPAFTLNRSVVVMYLSLLPVTAAAAIISLPVLFGGRIIRWWTALPVFGLLALGWLYFGSGYQRGIKYQSLEYTIFCGAMQAAVTVALSLLYIRNHRSPGFVTSTLFHGLTGLWLASYAFPYMGELP